MGGNACSNPHFFLKNLTILYGEMTGYSSVILTSTKQSFFGINNNSEIKLLPKPQPSCPISCKSKFLKTLAMHANYQTWDLDNKLLMIGFPASD